MNRNSKILVVFLSISLGIFMYSGFKGSKQIDKRKEDYQKYILAKQDIEVGENLEEAIKTLEYLEENYIGTDVLPRDKASVYLILGNNVEAERCLEEAFDKNPQLSQSVNVSLVYAETAYENNNIEKSKQLLENIISQGVPEEYTSRVEELANKLG